MRTKNIPPNAIFQNLKFRFHEWKGFLNKYKINLFKWCLLPNQETDLSKEFVQNWAFFVFVGNFTSDEFFDFQIAGETKSGEYVSKSEPARLNKYGNSGDCVAANHSYLKQFCFCKTKRRRWRCNSRFVFTTYRKDTKAGVALFEYYTYSCERTNAPAYTGVRRVNRIQLGYNCNYFCL